MADEDLSDPSRGAYQRAERTRTGRAAGLGTNGREPDLAHRPAGTGPSGSSEADDPDQVVWKRHRPPIYLQPRILLAVLVIVLGVGVLAFANRKPAWPPKPACDRVALASNVTHTRTGDPVYWAVTGGGGRYAVTIGATGVAVDAAGRLTVKTAEANTAGRAAVVQQPHDLTGCRLLGHFTMALPNGQYTLRLYRITGTTVTETAHTRIDSDGR